MTTIVDNKKLAQFDEFFSIDYNFSINAVAFQNELPDFEQFIATMPTPFKIASEIVNIDHQALKPLQTVAGVANQLLAYLNHQAKKIDLLVGYVLNQENNEAERFQATKFGGGGVVFQTRVIDTFQLGDYLTLKLFFLEENSAIYCMGEVVEIQEIENHFCVKAIFHHIREEDQELLVRLSLHQQSKQLQARAKKREIKPSI